MTVAAEAPQSSKRQLFSLPRPPQFVAVGSKYLLTESGVRYCASRQVPMKELRLHRGLTATGFQWSSINTVMLERLASYGFLAGVELERTEFLNERQEILRMLEILFQGILLRRFPPLLKKQLLGNPSFRKFLELGLPPERIQALARVEKPRTEALKQEFARVLENSGVRLLDLIDDSIWVLLNHAEVRPGRHPLKSLVLETLLTHSRRLELSEYLSVNLMEFLQQAEWAHFLNLADRDPLTRKSRSTVPELLADPEYRERLIDKAKYQKEFLVMHLGILGEARDTDSEFVVEITVRNKGVMGNQSRFDTLNTHNAPFTRESFEELLDDDAMEQDLVLLNLRSLKELCRKQGIHLETNLTRDERADETVASMRLVL